MAGNRVAKRAKPRSKSELKKPVRSVRTIEIAGSIRADLDTAALALEDAKGVLDLLITAISACGGEIPGALPNTLITSLNAAYALVVRADNALFEVKS